MDFSINAISDVSTIKDCSQLIKLNLSKNKIKSLAVFTSEEAFPNLKWLDVSHNKFGDFPAFKLPKLEYLDISYNKLEKVNEAWTGHDKLKIVKCIDNKFKSLVPFKSMPKLEELYMASNSMTSLSGWEALPALKKLHLRRNKIDKIDEELPELPALEYLNLRSNKIDKIEVFIRIFQFKTVTDVNILNNPFESSASSFRLLTAQCLHANPAIKRFCKMEITEKNLLEAVHYGQYKHEKDEEERKRLEAIEAAKEGED